MEHRKNTIVLIPFCFTGMGIFRVWTETIYSNGSLSFPAQAETGCGFAAFNILAAAMLLIFAFSARKIAPLYDKKSAYLLAGGCLSVSALLNFASILFPAYAFLLGITAVILGALGIALIILLWSELFSCLNPLRVGLYFSGGLIVGALILWLFKGLALPWLCACTCLIPPLSLYCLRQAYARLSIEERPHATWGHYTFPWKPIAIVALFSFSYGLCETLFQTTLGIHSGLGCVTAALIVYVGVSIRRIDFKYSLVYQLAGVSMILSLLPLSGIVPLWSQMCEFLALAGYTFALIAIMVILSNISYQYGVNAVWLFGIERAVRLLSVQGGLELSHALNTLSMPGGSRLLVNIFIAIMIILAIRFFLSEKQLTSPWGAVLKGGSDNDATSVQNRIGEKCNEVAKAFSLTPREAEIMLLLANGKKPAQIEQQLYVASSTVKTHIKHLYQKLDIHSRKDLFDLLGIATDPNETTKNPSRDTLRQ